MKLAKLLGHKMDRRRVLNNVGLMGLGAVAAACTPAMRAQPPAERNVDAAILNFALNLEYLEAAFYLAVVGRLGELPGSAQVILPAGINGNTDNSAGFSQISRDLALELAVEELVHVNFLRSALAAAGAPVAERPVIDLSGSFVAAADAAFSNAGIEGNDRPFAAEAFNPFAAEAFFLHASFIFEDVGVSAYKGAARFLTNKDFLEAAAGILAAEAYHSGAIRAELYRAARDATFGDLPVLAIVQAISDVRDAVGNPGRDKDQGLGSASGVRTAVGGNISLTDANGIAFSRTPREVANIVYLGTGTASGGFFPNGITVPTALAADFGFLLGL